MKILTRLLALGLFLALPSAVPTAGQIAGGALPTNKLTIGRYTRVVCVDSTNRQGGSRAAPFASPLTGGRDRRQLSV